MTSRWVHTSARSSPTHERDLHTQRVATGDIAENINTDAWPWMYLLGVVVRIHCENKYQEALNELELFVEKIQFHFWAKFLTGLRYLPSFPYQDNAVLHCYSGLLALQLSSICEDEETVEGRVSSDNLLRKSKASFERALVLDPENTLATELLNLVRTRTKYTCTCIMLIYF